MKPLIDYILTEDYDRYNELLDIAKAAKDATPKAKRTRAPQTQEQKVASAANRLKAAEAKLAELLAQQA